MSVFFCLTTVTLWLSRVFKLDDNVNVVLIASLADRGRAFINYLYEHDASAPWLRVCVVTKARPGGGGGGGGLESGEVTYTRYRYAIFLPVFCFLLVFPTFK